MKKYCLATLVFATFLSGCSTTEDVLYFGTGTSLGLDISGTVGAPDKVSLAYRRDEIAIIPPGCDGVAYPVLGTMDYDINFGAGLQLRQHFATGYAAELAAGAPETFTIADNETSRLSDSNKKECKDTAKADKPSEKPRMKTMVFATDTIYGLDLNAGQGATAPNLTVGHRRLESAIVPIESRSHQVRSVFADISINSYNTQSKKKTTATDVADNETAVPASNGDEVIPNTPVQSQASAIGGTRIQQSRFRGMY